jgi:hypothetical protein
MNLLPSTHEQRAEVLERVADGYESERYGWIQGRLVDPVEHSYCMIGAIGHELGFHDMDMFFTGDNMSSDICQTAGLVFGTFPQEIYMFNDCAGRKKQHVIDMLKLRAKDLRNKSGESE